MSPDWAIVDSTADDCAWVAEVVEVVAWGAVFVSCGALTFVALGPPHAATVTRKAITKTDLKYFTGIAADRRQLVYIWKL